MKSHFFSSPLCLVLITFCLFTASDFIFSYFPSFSFFFFMDPVSLRENMLPCCISSVCLWQIFLLAHLEELGFPLSPHFFTTFCQGAPCSTSLSHPSLFPSLPSFCSFSFRRDWFLTSFPLTLNNYEPNVFSHVKMHK